MRKQITRSTFVLLAAIGALLPNFSAFATDNPGTQLGPKGQQLKVSQTTNLTDGKRITVTGSKYSNELGIYVTFCVIPKKGSRPEICGPYDVTGANNQSVWISSNPPIYAAFLVTPFSKNGSFKVTIPVHSKIGDYDCKVLKCAVLTRADHTNSNNRTADVIIPVTFKK